MRVSLSLPTHRVDVPELMTGDAIMALARAAEDAGFAAVFVTEHPIPGDEWLASGGHHAFDPFVALTFAAAATTTLGLQTNLVIAAYRNPFLLAKSVASLDAASGGRMIVGIGAGYLDAEFAALGVEMSERNDLTDEAIAAMRAAWRGQSLKSTGRHWWAPGNTMLPKPAQDPGPPIWIGGNSRRAVRRAVELGDGWVPMLAPDRVSNRVRSASIPDLAELASRINEARSLRAASGRTGPFDVAFSPSAGLEVTTQQTADRFIANARDLAAAGVTFLNAGVPSGSLQEALDSVAWCGAEILPHLASIGP